MDVDRLYTAKGLTGVRQASKPKCLLSLSIVTKPIVWQVWTEVAERAATSTKTEKLSKLAVVFGL